MPNKAWPGIVFSHWGRLEVNHTSNTDYGPDDYSKPFVHADMDGDWRDAFKGHPCFDPKKVRLGSGRCGRHPLATGRCRRGCRGSARYPHVPHDLYELSMISLSWRLRIQPEGMLLQVILGCALLLRCAGLGRRSPCQALG